MPRNMSENGFPENKVNPMSLTAYFQEVTILKKLGESRQSKSYLTLSFRTALIQSGEVLVKEDRTQTPAGRWPQQAAGATCGPVLALSARQTCLSKAGRV